MKKRKQYSVILIFFLFGIQFLHAQRFAPDYWHNGGIVFNSGDTLKGDLFYSLSENTVQLEDNSKRHFFNAFKLNAIYFENALDSSFRVFHVYDYKLTNGYNRPQFFELLYQDSLVSLLGRERLMFLGKASGAGFGTDGVQMGFDYYLKFSSGNIIFLPSKKKDFINCFPDKQKQLQDFIKEKKIDYHSLEDVKSVVAFYNLIKNI